MAGEINFYSPSEQSSETISLRVHLFLALICDYYESASSKEENT